jgi:hypothetical protein
MRAASEAATPDRLGAMSETTTSTRAPPSACSSLAEDGVLAEVALDEMHALDGLELQHVQRDQGAVQRPGSRALGRKAPAQVLAPGARRSAEVHHHLPGPASGAASRRSP